MSDWGMAGPFRADPDAKEIWFDVGPETKIALESRGPHTLVEIDGVSTLVLDGIDSVARKFGTIELRATN